MLISIVQAQYRGDHRVWLQFNNGDEGVADLADLVARVPAASPLRDTRVFASFRLDDWPTLTWPCGFDVAPEDLYWRATGKRLAWLTDPSELPTAPAI